MSLPPENTVRSYVGWLEMRAGSRNLIWMEEKPLELVNGKYSRDIKQRQVN